MSDQAAPRFTNRLARETSPYLLQHAHNPVDWRPWGPEAWERARAEDRPVLVSIGYAACHWCHVMERECFEDEAIAALQNGLFLNIKVDREERPDVDEIYMEAVQLMRGQGGWPLNVFCLPDGRPFFGGTYFPPRPRLGLQSWPQVLEAVARAYRERRAEVAQQADHLVQLVGRGPEPLPADQSLDAAECVRTAADTLLRALDPHDGGFGGAPKFPQPYLLGLLLHRADADADPRAREAFLFSLRRMAAGGIYDHLGGGFHRYSVDAHWRVPHFEKMLYDNALLAALYVEAFRLGADSGHRQVASETLDYLLREMRAPAGPFYSSTDADSEGEEGKFFVWTPDQVQAVLGGDAAWFCRFYDVTPDGNFEGRSILHPVLAAEDAAAGLGMPPEDFPHRLAAARARLLAARAERIPPATDTKVITAWNGLAIDALARAGALLEAPRYVEAGARAARFLLDRLRSPDGLLRIYAGGRASVPAFSEDYAAFADGLLSLYEATGDERWFLAARDLADEMLDRFWDAERGGVFTTGAGHEVLVARARSDHDGATASANSLAARLLARLYALTAAGRYADCCEATARAHGEILARTPTSMPLLTVTLDWLRRHRTVAVVGPDGERAPLLAVARRAPFTTIAQGDGVSPTAVPQLEGKRPLNGRAAAYVCQGVACSAPLTDPDALARLLAASVPSA